MLNIKINKKQLISTADSINESHSIWQHSFNLESHILPVEKNKSYLILKNKALLKLVESDSNVIIPAKFSKKIKEYLQFIKIASESDKKEYPLLIMIGKESTGKKHILKYIQFELDCLDLKLSQIDSPKSHNETKVQFILSENKRILSLTKNKTKNFILNIDDTSYNTQYDEIMTFFAKKYDFKGKLPEKKLVLSKNIKISPVEIDNLFFQSFEYEKQNTDLVHENSLVEYLNQLETLSDKPHGIRVIKSNAKFDDLIASSYVKGKLKEVLKKVEFSKKDQPKFIEKFSNHDKVICLFCGEPGTGKSFSAEIIANELNTELWDCDFSTILDMYVGESEKHLTEIFKQAQDSQVVLRLDECDAFLQNRSSLKQGHEKKLTNHLLNLIENYKGILILTTNFITDLDNAFDRRINFKLEFNKPSQEETIEILKKLFYPDAPLASDFNWNEVLLGVNNLSGGFLKIAVERSWLHTQLAGKSEITSSDVNLVLKEIQKESLLLNKIDSRKSIGLVAQNQKGIV